MEKTDLAKLQAGYSYILERVLRHYDKAAIRSKKEEGPDAPYVLLDANSTIRYARDDITQLIRHTPEDLIGNSFGNFLSWEQYRAALRIIAHRADRANSLKENPAIENAEERGQDYRNRVRQAYAHLETDIYLARKLLSPPGKVASVNELVEKLLSRGEDKLSDCSKIRILDKDGGTVTLDDELILYLHPQGFYAGAFVSLKPPKKQGKWPSISLPWKKTADTYTVTNQYIVPVFSLHNHDAIRNTLSEIRIGADRAASLQDMVVLDFSMIDDFARPEKPAEGKKETRDEQHRRMSEDTAQMFLNQVKSRAEAGTLKLGNVPNSVEEIAAECFGKRIPGLCVSLDYAPLTVVTAPDKQQELTTHEEILAYVNQKTNVLEDKFHANNVSGQGVPPVQASAEGKGNDV